MGLAAPAPHRPPDGDLQRAGGREHATPSLNRCRAFAYHPAVTSPPLPPGAHAGPSQPPPLPRATPAPRGAVESPPGLRATRSITARTVALAVAMGALGGGQLGGEARAQALPLAPPATVARELAHVEARPRAPDALARLLRLTPSLTALSPARQRAALGALAAQRRAPRVAAYATWLELRFLLPAQARAAMGAQGFLTRALVAGPVPTSAAAPAATPARSAPALVALRDLRVGSPLAPGASVTGLRGSTPWRPAASPTTNPGPPGSLNLGPLMPRGKPAAALAVLALQADGPGRGVLRLGADAALAVAFNGALVGTAPASAHAVPDQLQAPITLRPGVNVLAVALASPSGRGGILYVRLTDPRGRPLAGVRAIRPGPRPSPRLRAAGHAGATQSPRGAKGSPWPKLTWRLDGDATARTRDPRLRWSWPLGPPPTKPARSPTTPPTRDSREGSVQAQRRALLRAAAARALGLPAEARGGAGPGGEATTEGEGAARIKPVAAAKGAEAPEARGAPAVPGEDEASVRARLATLLTPPRAVTLSTGELLLTLPHVAREGERVGVLEAQRIARRAGRGLARGEGTSALGPLDDALALLVAARGQRLRAARLLARAASAPSAGPSAGHSGGRPGLIATLARAESLRQRGERALAWRVLLGGARGGAPRAQPSAEAAGSSEPGWAWEGISMTSPSGDAPREATPGRATDPRQVGGSRGGAGPQPAPAEAWLQAAARLADELDRADLATRIYARLAAAAPGDETLLALVAQGAESSGRPREALARLQALARRRPDRPGYALEAARVALDLGRTGDARALLRGVTAPAAGAPLDPDPLISAGRLYERLDDEAQARRAYDAALAQRPTSPEALERLAALDNPAGVGARGVPSQERWRVPLTPGLAATPSRHPEAPFETLIEEVHLRVRADGGFSERRHRVLRVHEVPEERDGRTFFHRYDPSLVRARVVSARVHRPRRRGVGDADGDSRQDEQANEEGDHRAGRPPPALATRVVVTREESQLSEAWYGLYYDQRELAVPFDDLRPGDLVEVELAVDSAGAPPLPGTFDRLEILQDRTFRHRVVLVAEAPRALGLRVQVTGPRRAEAPTRAARGVQGPHAPMPPATVPPAQIHEAREDLPGGGSRWTVDARDLAALPAERYAPGTAEVSALVQLTSFASWDALATRYEALIEPQRVLTPAMRRWVAARVAEATAAPRPTDVSGDEAAAQAPSPAPNPTVLARAIAQGVAQRFRYVGLEFDIHGYQPYRTDQVWSRRFGDCKDQATLLTTLLRAAGIDAQVALVRTRPNGRVPRALPGLALFDHAIVWLPDQGLFFDPTVRTLGLGALPAVDQGGQALVLAPRAAVHGSGAEPTRGAARAALRLIPVQPAAAAGTDGDYTVAVAQDGAAGLQGVMKLRGTDAAPYRERLASPDARAARVEGLLNGRYPGLVLDDLSLSDPRALHTPLTLTFSAHAPDVGAAAVGARGGRTLEISWPGGASGLLDRWASDATRRLPVVLGPPNTYRFHFTYLLPPGFTASSLPPGGRGESPFGSYEIQWTRGPGVARVETRFVREVDQVNPDRYEDFRAFMRGFDARARVPLTLVKPAPAPRSRPPSQQESPAPGEAHGAVSADDGAARVGPPDAPRPQAPVATPRGTP